MCTTCGCGKAEPVIEGRAREHAHRHEDGTWHSHSHEGAHTHYRYAPAHTHAEHRHDPAQAGGEVEGRRRLRVEQDLLAKNDAQARANRERFAQRGIFALNLVSSPGSGKTTLLVKTIERLAGRLPLAVIEGDQQTSNDAERIRAAGARAIQVNAGKGCHLDADMVARAFERLDAPGDSLLLIENVGNLVCPAEFDLGEAHKVVVVSVTEGEDKPLKYPNMFAASDLMLLTKTDLLPHLEFDCGRCIEYARRINPRIEVMRICAKSGEGMDGWIDWLGRGVAAAALPAG